MAEAAETPPVAEVLNTLKRAATSRPLQQALLLSFCSLRILLFFSGTLVPIESTPRILQRV